VGFPRPFLHSSTSHWRGLTFHLSPADGDRGCRAVRSAHAPSPSPRARRSGGSRSRSWRRARKRIGSGGGSAESRRMSSSGCESSRDFLPQQPRRTRRRERRRKRATGGRLPPRAGSPRPLTESRGGGRGASVWGGRGSACRQAVHGRGGTRREGAGVRRGGVWECDGGDVGRGHSARRALEEEEAGLLHLEVGNRSSRRTVLERQEFNLFVFAFAGWRRPPPPSRLPRRSGRTRLSPRGGAHRGRSGCQEVRWRQRARPRASWSRLQIRN
jgi:hypothetical protein